MNCSECNEQVFELIEREALDPEGVREVLDRCPDCRALFDEMKAALKSAAQLPIEEAPAEIDAAVLRAARQRRAKVVPLRRKWFQSPQWAVAAIAMLAIGVGVWAIPSSERVADMSEPVAMEMADEVETEPSRDQEAAVEAAPREVAAVGELGSPEEDETAARQRAAATSKRAPQWPARAKRRSVADRDARAAAKSVAAPAAPEVQNMAVAGASADMAALEKDASGMEAKKERTASPECQKRLEKLEELLEEQGAGASIGPERALAIGRCYQEAGDVAEARRWLGLAASHAKTKRRALRALKELPAD